LKTFVAISLCSILVLSVVNNGLHAYAYEEDFHYYWTFFLALVCSFSWEEAHLIASADQRMDETDLEADLNDPDNENWHAFGTPDKVKKREDELWKRALSETDKKTQLAKFGQLLHFVQDENPHGGYPTGTGHAKDGHAPDSMGHDPKKTEGSTKDTLEYMKKMLKQLGRETSDLCDFEKIKHVLKMMEDQSKPGFVWNSGSSKNKETIGIAMYNLVPHKIPDSVKYVSKPDEPKKTREPEGLIPPVVEIEYDEKGEPKAETLTVALLATKPEIQVAMKHKEKSTLVSVRNNGDVPLYSVALSNPDGDIKLVKARGWDRDRLDSSTVLVTTDKNPIMPSDSLVLLLLTSSPIFNLEWGVGSNFAHMIKSGAVIEHPKQPIVSSPATLESKVTLKIIDSISKKPIVNATVIVTFEDGKIVYDTHGRITGVKTTGEDGTVQLDLLNGEYHITLQANDYSKASGTLQVNGSMEKTFELAPLPSSKPDFEISASPASLTIAPSSTADVTIKVTSLNGFNGTVNLSAHGVAKDKARALGLVYDIDTEQVTLSSQGIFSVASVTLRITVPDTAEGGTYGLGVNGNYYSSDTNVHLEHDSNTILVTVPPRASSPPTPPPPTPPSESTEPLEIFASPSSLVFRHDIDDSPCPQHVGKVSLSANREGTWEVWSTPSWINVTLSGNTANIYFNCELESYTTQTLSEDVLFRFTTTDGKISKVVHVTITGKVYADQPTI
jgi:hypothetical protein